MKVIKVILFIFLSAGILNAQWSLDPTVNNAICDLSGEQVIPKVDNGPTGDTYVGFFSNDSGNYDVRLQRLDSQGNELWDHNGILISDNPAMTWLTDWDMTVDAENHAILVFQDIRNAGNNNIYAYRISPDGNFVWGADGLELSNSIAFSASPKVIITSAGNAVVAWSEETISIMQKIAPDGTLLWGTSGITLSSANTISWPQPFAVDNDEILLKYFEDIGSFPALTRHCYIQKYDTDGNPVWTNPTVVSNAGGISAWTQIFNIISDENNGCFISWHDSRGGGMTSYPFVQHVLDDGTVDLAANGIQLSTENNRQNFYPESVYDAANDQLITYWKQTDGDQNNHGLTGQKVDVATGSLVWGNNGSNLIPISSTYVLLTGVRDTGDDLMIIFEDTDNAIIKAARIDLDGNYVWTSQQVTMCSVPSTKIHNFVSQLSGSQLIAAWEDDRNGSSDIFAQNINLDGTLGAGTNPNGTLEGNVILSGGIGNIEDVDIIISGATVIHPDATGYFSISLAPGGYGLQAELEYYTPITISNIVITSGVTTTLPDDIILEWIPVYNPPQNVTVDPNTGLITWDPPQPYPGAELIGHNIYLDGVFLEMITGTSYQLINLVYGLEYEVSITAVYEGGYESIPASLSFMYTGTEAGNELLTATQLIGNYPNPFNPSTSISFELNETMHVVIEVYNVKGKHIKTLSQNYFNAGLHNVNWNGTDKNNCSVASGVYLYKMKAGSFTCTKKMTLMK